MNIAEGEKRLRGKSLLDEINLSKIKGMNDSERDGIHRAGIELQGGWELSNGVDNHGESRSRRAVVTVIAFWSE